ncbi:MAG: VWA domain-containing protein [Deltaproteobacteria bacterium]|nr:VWA domain-containing protein [Deltaproteobacteria bacterium]
MSGLKQSRRLNVRDWSLIVLGLAGMVACGEGPMTFKRVEQETADSATRGEALQATTHDTAKAPGGAEKDDSGDARKGNGPRQGSGSRDIPDTAGPEGPRDPSAVPGLDTLSIQWRLPCQHTALDSGAIVGGGRHAVTLGQASKLAVTFSGTVCEPAPTPREIVLVVDVTGSMGPGTGDGFNHDPMRNGSCGRMEAVRHVLAKLPADGSARVSLITFNSRVTAKSSEFHTNGATLFADLESSTRRPIANVLCAADGETDYAAALSTAGKMLDKFGRTHVQREIYFVTDGIPTVRDGVREAWALKADGVMIAPIMLIGDESILRDKIASRDSSGQPFFRKVAEANELPRALADLAVSKLVSVQLKYRAVGKSNWESVNLVSKLQGYSFGLAPLQFDMTLGDGFEMRLETLDNRGRKTEVEGVLMASPNP